MWWGSTPKGNPKSKKLKTAKLFHHLVQIHEAHLHLFLGPLPLDTIAVCLVDPDQPSATSLHLLDDPEDQVHPPLHLILAGLSFRPPLFKLHAQPLVSQPLDFLIEFSQDGSVAACRRHGNAQTSARLRVTRSTDSPLLSPSHPPISNPPPP